jgi:putative ABC transport system permease protein
MRRLRMLWARVKGQAAQGREDVLFDEEIREHIALLEDRFRARGMSADKAAREARRQFGNVTILRAQQRAQRGFLSPSEWWRDARFGARMLARTPSVTLMAVLTLALGIGLNVAIFTVLDALMFKALPVVQPERLVQLRRANGDDSFTNALWKQIRAQQDAFSGVFAYQGNLFDSASAGEKHFVTGLYVSGSYFSTLGVSTDIGRVLSDQDDRRGAALVAVISYPFWKRQFGGDPGILNRQITLEKHKFQVVGVTPADFYGTDVGYQFDVAVPIECERVIEPEHPLLDNPLGWWLYVFGRLKPGVTLEQAQARMRSLSPQINAAALAPHAGAATSDWYTAAIELSRAATGVSALRDNYGKALVLVSIMLGIVLLIVCANVANLQLVRFSTRRREFAVRAALGAARARLLRQLAIENLMLAAAGAGAGLLIANYASHLLVLATSSRLKPSILDLSIDYRLVLFVAGITIATAMFFGIAPALQVANVAPQNAMKQDSQATSGRRRRDWPRVLVPLQVGLSIVLLFGTALFVRSLDDLVTQKLGFKKEGVLLVTTDLDTYHVSDQLRQQLASGLQQRMQAIPGVLSVSRSAVTPISGMSWQWNVKPQIEGKESLKVHVFVNLVSPGFFRTLGIPLISGRDFEAYDDANAPLVAIVNQTAAMRMFSGSDAIGRSYRDDDPEKHPLVQVVGLVGDAKYRSLRDAIPPTIYLPITQNPAPFPVTGIFEVHFSGAAPAATRQIEEASTSVDPQISLECELLSDQVNDALHQAQMIAALATGFSVLALVLACIGMYGVMAYSVAGRTIEIGVRIALGARRSNVVQMVLRESLWLVAVGLVAGIPLALVAAHFVRTMLFDVRPADPLSMVLTTLVIIATTSLAAYRPAAHAARIDPARALRSE